MKELENQWAFVLTIKAGEHHSLCTGCHSSDMEAYGSQLPPACETSTISGEVQGLCSQWPLIDP